VAKRRPQSRKGVKKTARAKGARKTVRRRAGVRQVAPARPSLPLRDLQKTLGLAVAALDPRLAEPGEVSDRASQAITIFKRWSSDIEALCATGTFCGSTMDPFA
jgi:hypothetical protein